MALLPCGLNVKRSLALIKAQRSTPFLSMSAAAAENHQRHRGRSVAVYPSNDLRRNWRPLTAGGNASQLHAHQIAISGDYRRIVFRQRPVVTPAEKPRSLQDLGRIVYLVIRQQQNGPIPSIAMILGFKIYLRLMDIYWATDDLLILLKMAMSAIFPDLVHLSSSSSSLRLRP